MRAIVIKQYGGPEQLQIENVSKPEPRAGHILVRVAAFGLNRAETYMRRGLWGDVAKISGIECVGTVVADQSARLPVGAKVACVMGGMGRTIDGSYAEYVCTPSTNVVPLTTELPWAELAAIPESYATAWSCLEENLQLREGQTVLIRGAGSALGQAAVNIAAERGAAVIASVRTLERASSLRALGARDVLQEQPGLAQKLRNQVPGGVDAVMDIVGNSTLLDSLQCARRGGRVCVAGFLGGLQPLASFDPLTQMPSDVHLSFFASYMLGSDDFPLARIPLQSIVDKAAAGRYRAKPAKVYRFDQIQTAHRVMEEGNAGGKLVVTVE